MYTVLISVAAAVAVGYFSAGEWGYVWGVICGFFTMLVTQLIVGLILRGKIMAGQQRIQNIMQQAQARIERQMNLYQLRPPASMNAARQQLEKLQTAAARAALEETGSFKRFYRWNFMLERQINAMKVQLHYQLKEYKMVDQLLPKSMVRDPQSMAIAMVRSYRNGDEAGLDKFYRRRCRSVKGESGAFLASVYGWIKLKQGNSTAAREALVAAGKHSDHPVLLENTDKLKNGKEKQYSMSGFGDMWYALALEEPKVKAQRRRQMY